MITTTIDTSGLAKRMQEIQAALIGNGHNGDMRTILADESRLLCRDMIRFTPPPGGLGQGRKAVGRDIGKIMRPPPSKSEEFTAAGSSVLESAEGVSRTTAIREPKIAAALERYIAGGEVGKIREMFRRIGITIGEPRDMSQADMAAHHRAHQDRRGRVRRAGVVLMPLRGLGKYIAATMKRVGRMKAGWGPAFVALGGKLPGWVANHMKSQPPGYVVNQITQPNNPSITIANNAPGAESRLASIARSAVAIRGRSIAQRLTLAMSGYASDVKRRIPVRRNARKVSPATV